MPCTKNLITFATCFLTLLVSANAAAAAAAAAGPSSPLSPLSLSPSTKGASSKEKLLHPKVSSSSNSDEIKDTSSLSVLPESDEQDFDWAKKDSDNDSASDDDYDAVGAAEEESYEEKLVLGKEIDYRTAALEFINFYRANHGAPGLVLDPALSTQAQAWADNLTATNTLEYSCTPDLTPQLTTWKLTPTRAAVQQWYREGLKYGYQYGAPTPTVTTGKNVLDFTAMLWKGSKKVGFGLATDKNGEIVFVANYAPAGNIFGAYGKNVLP